MVKPRTFLVQCALAGVLLGGGVLSADEIAGDRMVMDRNNTSAIEYSDGWVRLVPPVSSVTAAYLALTNHSHSSDTLVGVSSEQADKVELHTMDMSNGMMKMQQVQQVSLPMHQRVELSPGGLHIMMMGLKKPLTLDDHVTLRLEFAESDPMTVTLPVRQDAGEQEERAMDHSSSHKH